MSAPNKIRLDQLLVEKGLAESRTKAQALIMARQVRSGELVLSKAGQMVASDTPLTVVEGLKYVSRAGLKLESVASGFGINFQDKVVLDVGASTGGFTDFALQNGAAKVYAVDVGRGQLHHKLRNDNRVVVMEQTDIRDAKLPELADIALVDVSFISLTKVLDFIATHLKPDGEILMMAKPQFEATKEIADRFGGVIKDAKIRSEILEALEAKVKDKFKIVASADSKVAGAEGNVERFYLLKPKS